MVLCARQAHSPWLRLQPFFREDCLERIHQLQLEVNTDLRELARMKKKYAATEERLRQRKKEFGWID